MPKRLFITLLAVCFSIYNYGAISVTAPSSAVNVKSADDFATTAFNDPWDMNERTDLGWFIWDVTSGSRSNLANIAFSGGIFSATSTSNDPNIFILDTGVLGTCFLGKIGTNFKINASTYKIFAIRMKLNKAHDALLFWSKNTIYQDISRSGPFSVKSGWGIYILSIPSLGSFAVAGSKTSWSGEKAFLRFDPAPISVNIDIDWIRLLKDDNSLDRTITWTGNSGTVDIYLDNDQNEGNGTLGLLASKVSGTSYKLFVGALAPGTRYYVGIKNNSGGSLKYSSGYYMVNAPPTLEFTSPSPEGGDDFATTEIGNAWDMNALSDLDLTYRINNQSITGVSSENVKGDNLGSVSVFKGTSQATAGVGDPVLYTLLWWGDGRGQTYPIDTDKYRILVLKMSLPGNWDLNEGSIARIIWKLVGEGDSENVSEDVIIRHKSGSKKVMNTIIADMKNLPLEAGAGSPSKSGWTGMVEGFRIDPLEFSAATEFYIQSIKIAAYERADASYTIKWNHSDPDADLAAGTSGSPDGVAAAATVSFYRDNNNSGFNGTAIASGVSASAGSYSWNTSNVAAGTYYIYGVITDGTNSSKAYARWPIVVDHTVQASPTISLNKSSLSFNSSGSQNFTVSNSGGGTLSWTASDNKSWMSVSPTSGTNSGTVTVTVSTSGLSAGTYTGTVTVSGSGATNSPRTVSVTLTVPNSGGTATILLSRDKLYFGSTPGQITSPQKFLVTNSGTGTLNWSASDNKSWISVSPSSGSNTGEVTVTTNSSGLSAGTYGGTVTVSDPNATNSSQTVTVQLKVYNSGSQPFGSFATPTDGSSGSSSIPVTGWALDDTEIVSVKIYNGTNYVGDAVFVEGSRPDVAQAYPDHPLNYRAGWGYMMLTNFLPNGGNGSYTFVAKATDKEGNTVTLGSKTVTLDNANAVKPFGAIDAPSQGGTASGSSFINWGWALTPQPNSIPTNGSTIDVWIDGVKVGHPTYNIFRSDIATFFPSYANSNGAVGFFYIDTTTYSTGTHSIQWTARDSANNTDGIGSRFFTIQNTGSDLARARDNRGSRVSGSRFGVNTLRFNADDINVQRLPSDVSTPVWIRTGYERSTALLPVYPDDNGVITIPMKELERVEIHFFADGETGNTGVAAVNGSSLPVGSTLDGSRGIFYWQSGLAYLGDYPLQFIKAGKNGWFKKDIVVRINPKH